MTALVSFRQQLVSTTLTDTTADIATEWFRVPAHSGFFIEYVASASTGTFTVTLTTQIRFDDDADADATTAFTEPITGNGTTVDVPLGAVNALPRGTYIRLASTDDLIATETITLVVTAYWAAPGALVQTTIA